MELPRQEPHGLLRNEPLPSIRLRFCLRRFGFSQIDRVADYGRQLMPLVLRANALRVRVMINSHFLVVKRPLGKARGVRIASYLSDEQRSRAG